MQMNERTGYVAAAIGGAAGGLVLAIVGTVVGGVYADHSNLIELDALGPMLIGVAAGLWIGPALGCWIGLRARRHDAAARTALTLLVTMPLWLAIGLPVAAQLANLLPESSSFGPIALHGPVVLAWLAIELAVAGALTRLLVLRAGGYLRSIRRAS